MSKEERAKRMVDDESEVEVSFTLGDKPTKEEVRRAQEQINKVRENKS